MFLETKTWAHVVLRGRDKVSVTGTALLARLPSGTLEATVNISHTVGAFQRLGLPSSSKVRGHRPAHHSPDVLPLIGSPREMGGVTVLSAHTLYSLQRLC